MRDGGASSEQRGASSYSEIIVRFGLRWKTAAAKVGLVEKCAFRGDDYGESRAALARMRNFGARHAGGSKTRTSTSREMGRQGLCALRDAVRRESVE